MIGAEKNFPSVQSYSSSKSLNFRPTTCLKIFFKFIYLKLIFTFQIIYSGCAFMVSEQILSYLVNIFNSYIVLTSPFSSTMRDPISRHQKTY